MGIIKNIIDDYENLIKTKITIPLDNGDVIKFEFQPQDLPHQITLDIYSEEIRASMVKNPHYKYLISNSEIICDEFGNINQEKIFKCENEDIKKHYQLLRADELNKAYLPYMDKGFRWTNDEKCNILSEIDHANKVLYPGEIKMLLNQYRQKSK